MFEVSVPDGVSGKWRVESFVVTEEAAARTAIRSMFRPLESVPAGSYKRLMRGGTVVMSNTPMEIRTNMPIIRRARGNILINGLGLGVILAAILAKPGVEHITVVEKSEDVIQLVGPTFSADPRVSIVHADALNYKPNARARFNAVWHDIWDDICSDNLPEMHTLHRRYGRRADWQGSWSREICERCAA